MLETIRTAAKTWIAKVILALITIPFALWGVESYVRPPGQETVADVAGDKISRVEFDNALRSQIDRYRQQFGNQIDASIMDNPETRTAVLDGLIDQKLLAGATVKVGLVVSDSMLRDRIFKDSNFQDNGQFSKTRYDIFLKSQGYTDVSYESLLRREMSQQQFLESVSASAFAAKTSVAQYFSASEQSREVAVINIAPEPFVAQVVAKATITPERAKAYFEEKKKDYTTPEQVRAEYVELSIDALAPAQQVSAEEVQAYYESNKARYVTKEERKASHILINAAKGAPDADKKAAKDKADALLAQLKKAPKEFAELAKKHSQDPGSGTKGGDLGFFGRGTMVGPFEQAAFSGQKDQLLGPIETDFGYHIIKVTDIKPEAGKSLADAKPEIEGELKKQKASRKFAEAAEKFSNAAYEQSTSLKAAAEAAGLPIRQSSWFSKEQAFIPPFNNPKLAKSLFSDDVLKNKRNTEAVEISASTLVAARILETKPAVVRPFAEIEQSIIARLSRDEAGKLARADGATKLAALKVGKGQVKFPAVLAVNRNNPGGLAQAVIDGALRVNPKSLPTYFGVDNPADGGYTLVMVAKVVEPAATDETKLASARTRLQQTVGQGELVSTLAALRRHNDVTVNKGAIAKVADQTNR